MHLPQSNPQPDSDNLRQENQHACFEIFSGKQEGMHGTSTIDDSYCLEVATLLWH